MEKRREFIFNALYIAIICAIIYIGINYLLPILLPFIFGSLFAYAAIKLAKRFFDKEDKLHRGIMLVVIYLAVIILIVVVVSLGITKLNDFIRTLPSFYKNTLEPYMGSLENTFLELGESLPENLAAFFSDVTDGIFEGLKTLLSRATTGIVNLTTSIITTAPELLVSIIVMIVSSFYMVFDYENISRWFLAAMPDKALDVYYQIKDFFENTLLKIIGSYVAIMGLTFLELFIGLSLVGISNSGMWALIISFLDILPVLGVGTVLLPWSISLMISKRLILGLEILTIYLIITVIRNIVEPRLVGTNLGLHPLATLIAMITGLRLFSFVGMFGLPLTLSFFVSRDKEKKLLIRAEEKSETVKNKKDKKKKKK
ncbi:MAG: AI-2E family transporter [Erysipelotrichaceae bacterium]|nr:AI-2E family transporter [Erysipelotrichaceae bacterium]